MELYTLGLVLLLDLIFKKNPRFLTLGSSYSGRSKKWGYGDKLIN